MKRARFITLEGGEGSGKTTLAKFLSKELQASGEKTLLTREPGGTQIGEAIRKVLLSVQTGSMSKQAELCLFLASRAEHVDHVILPALQSGQTVLCDRFNDSTMAYQGYARGLDLSQVESMCLLACQNLKPDFTFYLDIDPVLGLKRAQNQAAHDRMELEGLSFHQTIRKAYLSLCEKEPERMIRIDASQTIEQVQSEVLSHVRDTCRQ